LWGQNPLVKKANEPTKIKKLRNREALEISKQIVASLNFPHFLPWVDFLLFVFL